MVYSGIINWGPVEAIIKIYNVVITNGQLVSAEVIIALNGNVKMLSFRYAGWLRRYKKWL